MKFGRRAESPIDDQLAEADIQDRLALANTLRQRSMEGASLDNVGGHLIGSPWARALTGVAQGVQGAGERKRAYSMAGDLATSKRERLAQALGGAGQEPTPEARLKRGMELMGHPDPQAQAVGQYMAESAQKEIQQAAEAQQKQYGETNKDLRHMQDLYQRDQEGARRDAATRDAAQMRADAIKSRGPSAGSLPASSIQEINYLRSLDALPPEEREAKRNEFFQVKRAQQIIDRGGSQDVVQPGEAPGTIAVSLPKTLAPNQTAEHAYDVAGAKKQGEAAAGRAAQQAKAPDTIAGAKALLDPNVAETMPTQSGIGSAIDRLGSLVGISPSGAKEAERLRVLGGTLTSLVPRFEGPQGVRDVELYQEMAGRVGDDTIPADRRLAALAEVEAIIMRNGGPAKVFGSGGAPAAPPPADDEDALIGKYLDGQP